MKFEMPADLQSKIHSRSDLIENGIKSKNLSVKVQILKPGECSSLPHAESLEEEFFYVLQGTPLVWLDGYTYQLGPGHCVGFPSGEGLCHNVINESSGDVFLLVIGEKTKKENRCVFPLHPDELKNNPSFNWTSWPQRKLGPHPGTAGSGVEALDASKHQRIVFAPKRERQKPFSYTGSTETFGRGSRISDALDLNVLGFWHELLDPTKRSSWPHCHSEDEEFCYILNGHPQVWMNGYVKTLQPGDLVYFEPGTSLSHTLINPSPDVVEYLAWGLSFDLTPDDAVYYPLHPERNNECENNGNLWTEYKKPDDFGGHQGLCD
jgi:uncharacterized cupin superfamily protein